VSAECPTEHAGTLPVRGRRQIGIGTPLTLFVVRAMYMLAGSTHTRDGSFSQSGKSCPTATKRKSGTRKHLPQRLMPAR